MISLIANLTWIDIAIIAILAISTLMSLWRGFIREAMSLVVWVLAFFVAASFQDTVAAYLAPAIHQPTLRASLSYGLAFVGTLAAGAVVNFFLGHIVSATGLSGLDRLLGAVFGAARGAVVIAALIVAGEMLDYQSSPAWQRSRYLPPFKRLSVRLIQFLPDNVSAYIHGHGKLPGPGGDFDHHQETPQ